MEQTNPVHLSKNPTPFSYTNFTKIQRQMAVIRERRCPPQSAKKFFKNLNKIGAETVNPIRQICPILQFFGDFGVSILNVDQCQRKDTKCPFFCTRASIKGSPNPISSLSAPIGHVQMK